MGGVGSVGSVGRVGSVGSVGRMGRVGRASAAGDSEALGYGCAQHELSMVDPAQGVV